MKRALLWMLLAVIIAGTTACGKSENTHKLFNLENMDGVPAEPTVTPEPVISPDQIDDSGEGAQTDGMEGTSGEELPIMDYSTIISAELADESEEEGAGTDEESGETSEADLYGPDSSKKYVTISKWSDEGVYFGRMSDQRYAAFNESGECLFTLPPDVGFAYDEEDIYVHGYARLTNDTVIDVNGNEVYSPESFGHDGIVIDETLDVGYIICSKKEDTFNDSATHYFAVNLADGTSVELKDEETNPAGKTDYDWYYLGDGFFINDRSHGNDIFNITTGTLVREYCAGEYGPHDEEHLPYLYLPQRMYFDSCFYCTSGRKELLYKVDLITGELIQYVCANGGGAYGYKEENVKGLYRIRHIDEYEVPFDILLDPVTGEEYPMSLYTDFEVLNRLEDGRLLCKVQNKDKDRFVTVVNKDGTYGFEPIYCGKDSRLKYGDTGFALEKESNQYDVYDYEGNFIVTVKDGCVWFDKEAILYKSIEPGRGYVLYHVQTGTETDIPSDIMSSDKNTLTCIDGGFLCQGTGGETVIIHDDGSYVYFEEPTI